jgi:hypothetical protein
MTTFCLKWNNCSVKEPCPLCKVFHKADMGLWTFLESSWEAVCGNCAQKHAPELAQFLGEHGHIQSCEPEGGR